MGTGLVFGGMGNRLRIGLLEKREYAGGGLIGGLVEESHDVLCAVLVKLLVVMFGSQLEN